jgi:hypothetical protein
VFLVRLKHFYCHVISQRKEHIIGNKPKNYIIVCANNVDEELASLSKFLSDRSQELESLHSYPHSRSLWTLHYITAQRSRLERLNCPWPWVGEYPLQSWLSADHFKMLIFLRSSKWWFHCCMKSMAIKQSNYQTLKQHVKVVKRTHFQLNKPILTYCSSSFIVFVTDID